MAQLTLSGSSLGTGLEQLLLCDEIVPGADPGYQTCKTIFLYHPLGQKIAEGPVKMAQDLDREISIENGPDEELIKAFNNQWANDDYTKVIRSQATQARVYGLASSSVVGKTIGDTDKPLEYKNLADTEIAFNVLDPLNTAGSLVLDQNPNSIDFQKYRDIAVNGMRYHRSRTVTLMNESPIYIAYTTSAYGFVGRSVYQRGLYPLKSYIQVMRANDFVARKAGLLIAMIKMGSSVVNAIMSASAAFKRQLLKISQTDNVVSMSAGDNEDVKSVDLTNIDGPLALVRKNILEDIAMAADMPAIIINNESFAEGFGEGTEDAKKVASYIDGIRKWMQPCYGFYDTICQRRAWNEGFYRTMCAKYPKLYKGVDYEQAFQGWRNAFVATWPSLIREPESEAVQVEDVKLKALVASVQVLLPLIPDIENKVELVRFFEQNVNATKMLFTVPLEFDYDALEAGMKEQQDQIDEQALVGGPNEPVKPPPPFSGRDSSGAVAAYLGAPTGDTKIQRRIANLEDYVRRKGIA